MPDPIRLLTDWAWRNGNRAREQVQAGQILQRDPVQYSAQIIAYNELRVWFEPRWRDGRYLARRFPHCLICSIPDESDTPNLHRVPGWRPRRPTGIL